MKLKIFSFISLFLGISSVSPYIISEFFMPKQNAIGIIGGAELPDITYRIMFMSNYALPLKLLVIGITLIVIAVFCLIFEKTIKEHCFVPTTLVSLGLSSLAAAGLGCLLVFFKVDESFNVYPIEYPLSAGLVLLSLAAFISLIIVYVKLRNKRPSGKGFIIDALTFLVSLPSFISIFDFFYKFLNEMVEIFK